jgi:hypothetical protein
MTSSAIVAPAGSNGAAQRAFRPGCTLQGYADLKCLSTAFLEQLGLSDMLDRGDAVLRIPYRDEMGSAPVSVGEMGLRRPWRAPTAGFLGPPLGTKVRRCFVRAICAVGTMERRLRLR